MDKQFTGDVQGRIRRSTAWTLPVALLSGVGLLLISGCSGQDGAASSAEAARTAPARKLPQLASAPKSPRLMQVYFNTQDRREWIYDGVQWVPHDRSVDDFNRAVDRESAEKVPPGSQGAALNSAPFTPTGAHTKHRAFACAVCHPVGGTPCLDPVVAGNAASFDSTAKTCSNVSCHGAYSGTFTYSRWDYGIDDIEWVSVQYVGSGGGAASWYSTGSTGSNCSSCHGNPPAPIGNWHSSTHGFSWLTAARKCETCHPDAISAVVGGTTVGVSINAAKAAMHANGVANVQGKFTSQCFGCH